MKYRFDLVLRLFLLLEKSSEHLIFYVCVKKAIINDLKFQHVSNIKSKHLHKFVLDNRINFAKNGYCQCFITIIFTLNCSKSTKPSKLTLSYFNRFFSS